MIVRFENWKGATGDYTIHPRTFITGPNGTGKTRILEAIAYALSGRVPGLTPAGVWIYGEQDQPTRVVIRLEDKVVERGFTRKGAKATETFFHSDIDQDDLPDLWIMDATSFFQMSPKQQRQSILGFLLRPKEVAEIVRAQFEIEGISRLYSPPKPEEDIPSWLERLAADFSTIAKTRKEDVTSLEARLEPYAKAGIPADPTAALKEINDRIEHLRSSLGEQSRIRDQIRRLMDQIEMTKKTIAELQHRGITEEQIESAREELKVLRATTITIPTQDLHTLQEKIYKLRSEISIKKKNGKETYQAIKQGVITCPYLKDTCPSGEVVITKIRGTLLEEAKAVKKMEAELRSLEEEAKRLQDAVDRARQEKAKRDQRIAELTEYLRHAENDLLLYKQAQENLRFLQAELDKLPEVPPEDDATQAIRDQLVSLEEERARLQAALQQKAEYDAMLGALQEARSRYEEVKTARKIIKRVSTEKVKKALDTVLDAASRKIQATIGATITVKESRGTLTWEVDRNGLKTPIEALSQGERAVVSSAILTALWESANRPLSVVLLEGAELDTANLEKVMQILGNAKLDYVVIASCHSPKKEVKGWATLTLA